MTYLEKPLKAVLFDFDGVLAETMQDNFLAWKHTFAKEGIDISSEDYLPLEGASLNEVIRIISEKHGVNLSNPENIVHNKDNYFKEIHSFSFYPGVIEFVETLKSKGIKVAIVTSARKKRLFSTTPNDFLEKFDSIVTGDDFKIGKPDPAPYLSALDNLNLDSSECIVIENAPLGVKSAKSAKVFCVAICSTLGKDYLREADIVVESFKNLNDLEIFKTCF